MEKIVRLLFCVIPLSSFAYWLMLPYKNGGPYSDTELLWGGGVTIILTVAAYLYSRMHKRIENFSIAWALVVSLGSSLFLVGLIIQNVIGYDWGAYMWFIALWFTCYSVVLPKEFKHKVSFFKRPKPIVPGESCNKRATSRLLNRSP